MEIRRSCSPLFAAGVPRLYEGYARISTEFYTHSECKEEKSEKMKRGHLLSSFCIGQKEVHARGGQILESLRAHPRPPACSQARRVGDTPQARAGRTAVNALAPGKQREEAQKLGLHDHLNVEGKRGHAPEEAVRDGWVQLIKKRKITVGFTGVGLNRTYGSKMFSGNAVNGINYSSTVWQ